MKAKCDWCGHETGYYLEIIEYKSGFRCEKRAYMCDACASYGKRLRM